MGIYRNLNIISICWCLRLNVYTCVCAYIVCAHLHLCTYTCFAFPYTVTNTHTLTCMHIHALAQAHIYLHCDLLCKSTFLYKTILSIWHIMKRTSVFVFTALCCPLCSITKVCCMWVIFVQYFTKTWQSICVTSDIDLRSSLHQMPISMAVEVQLS